MHITSGIHHFRSRRPQSLAQELVPGNYTQVQEDLLAFPEPVLDLMTDYGIRVAVLNDGETLAESPALRHLTPAEYDAEISKANEITKKALSEFSGGTAMEFAEKTTRTLRKAGLDFHYGLSRHNPTPEQIAERQNISDTDFPAWKDAFDKLNDGIPQGLYILPHVYDEGKPISENQLRSARETTAEYVEGALGLNRPEDRYVLLHEKYTPAKATEIGNYRLVIHEMGHALDHVLDRLVSVPGFGAAHRQTIDALYEADMAKAKESSVEEVFTTNRAADNAREFFAEAVEAYLTQPNDDGGDIFRAENSNPGLLKKNPELYNYVDKIMTTDFTEAEPPGIPARPLLPDFVPDPDAAVISL